MPTLNQGEMWGSSPCQKSTTSPLLAKAPFSYSFSGLQFQWQPETHLRHSNSLSGQAWNWASADILMFEKAQCLFCPRLLLHEQHLSEPNVPLFFPQLTEECDRHMANPRVQYHLVPLSFFSFVLAQNANKTSQPDTSLTSVWCWPLSCTNILIRLMGRTAISVLMYLVSESVTY